MTKKKLKAQNERLKSVLLGIATYCREYGSGIEVSHIESSVTRKNLTLNLLDDIGHRAEMVVRDCEAQNA